MTGKTGLDDYAIVLRCSQTLVVAAVRELNIFGRGATPDDAVADLRKKYEALQRDLQDAQNLGIAPVPLSAASEPLRRSGTAEISLFAGKLLIVLAIVGVGGAWLAKRTEVVIEQKLSLPRLLAKTSQRAQALSPEQVGELAAQIRVLVETVKPVSAELRPLFDTSCAGTPTAKKP